MRDAEHRQRQAALAEQAQQRHTPARLPYSYSDSMRHVAVGERLRADDLGQERLRRRVAVQHRVLGAFLVVEDELHGDAGAARPARVRRRGP